MKKTEATILILDDEEDILLSAKLLLKRQYTNIITSTNPQEINRLISIHAIDVILLDMNYRLGVNDGEEGLYWLKHILEIKPNIVVILMTAFGEVELAVEAIKKGGFDFILKPWSNEKFLATIHAAVGVRRSKQKIKALKTTNKALKEEINKEFGEVVGSSDEMRQLMDTVNKVSETDANVLILGENGTGKEHLAREIHRRSKRNNKVFIHVDLGSLAETLFESELFGHKKGAFTDAKEDKLGRFELARGGTIFLDEIGNLPVNLQSKLLSVLQDRKVSRLGEAIERPVKARMIFATNAPIHQRVEEGEFRKDLLYRINTIELEIPPLRKRRSDIPEFIDYYLRSFKKKYKKSKLEISQNAVKILKEHSWPGNIRELQHTIERGVIMSDGNLIKAGDFNLVSSASERRKSRMPEILNIKTIEKLLIEKALEKHHGNISKASKELGLTRAALYRRMEKYGLYTS
ncbi:MAG: sigma-54-dependent Fis family transcriptional regulator [Bacteroidetes bacterium]|nr:sigma-54-dependent Fis family transcriptional regulator [Bacteroidota bacterium]